MLTILEMLLIAVNIPVLIWPLLKVKRVPRFLDYLPLSGVILLILHLFIDNEPVKFRFMSLYLLTIIIFFVTIGRLFKHNPNQPKRRFLAVSNSIFGIVMLVFATLLPTVILPFNPLPEPTGIYDVSTVSSDFTDDSRIETYSEEQGPRRLAVQFWYPTYRTGPEIKYNISGAPVSAKEQNYPVVIFSHGAFGIRLSNASACRELASHGFIVASIDHTYHSFFTSFKSGEKIIINNEFLNQAIGVTNGDISLEETFKLTHEWLDLRTADVSFIIDTLKAGNLADAAFLSGYMDLDNIGLFGHSLGGASSAEVARNRDDVKAAIVIDGTMIGDITGLDGQNKETLDDESFTKPLMQMFNATYLSPEGKASNFAPNVNAYENASAPVYALCVKDSGHLNFTDLPRISPFLSDMLGIGSVDSYECIKIVNDYSLAFFETYLKGNASPLLDEPASSLVQFEKK